MNKVCVRVVQVERLADHVSQSLDQMQSKRQHQRVCTCFAPGESQHAPAHKMTAYFPVSCELILPLCACVCERVCVCVQATFLKIMLVQTHIL
jgi:hypothetical protein